MPSRNSSPRRSTAVLLTLVLVAAGVLLGAPASAAFTGYAWSTSELYEGSTFSRPVLDTGIARTAAGHEVVVWGTDEDDTVASARVLSRTRIGDTWSPAEEIDADEETGDPHWTDVFATPDGGVVAVWARSNGEAMVTRSAVRPPGGTWSEPTVLHTGSAQGRDLLRQPGGATILWVEDERVRSLTWYDGGWGEIEVNATTGLPTFAGDIAVAVRPTDGRVSVVVPERGATDFGDTFLHVSHLQPGEEWTTPVRSHQRTHFPDACDTVGILDQFGNIKEIAQLCDLDLVLGAVNATYDPDGDLRIWWDGSEGRASVSGTWPSHQFGCACVKKVRTTTFPDGAGPPTDQVGTLVPGLEQGAAMTEMAWDADGDRTVFVGGRSDEGGGNDTHSWVRFYRGADNVYSQPDGSFPAPGCYESSRFGYVVTTVPEGDDLLVFYQHNKPCSNSPVAPGGSCNAFVLHGDDTLGPRQNVCLDGNLLKRGEDYVRGPGSAITIASGEAHRLKVHAWADADGPDPETVPATIAVTPSTITYATGGTVAVRVTGAGVAASGTVRLRHGTTVLGTRVLDGDGRTTFPVGRGTVLPGARTVAVDFLGSPTVDPGTQNRALTVARSAPARPTVVVVKAPRKRQKGVLRIGVLAPAAGLATPTGKVVLRVKKGTKVVTITRTLSAGRSTITLPKLAKGRWTAVASYAGDVRYTARASAARAFRAR